MIKPERITLCTPTEHELQTMIFSTMDSIIDGYATFTNPAQCADGTWISTGVIHRILTKQETDHANITSR